ncbi:MAG: HNH endonuclease [Candidatus Chloroheliales bacterium]|nr:MAG: HNH endonuclease [Chloroflexota bacterium]
MAKRGGARQRILDYLLGHVGQVVTSEQLREIAGVSEWARRLRELRDELGYRILSHNDKASLRPGEYILESAEPVTATERAIGSSQRARILSRDGFTCQICGATQGDPDPTNPERRLRLHVDHIQPISGGGTNEDDNLRTLCSACNEGRSNLYTPPTEAAMNVLELVRRQPKDVQREVYKFLKRKFNGG